MSSDLYRSYKKIGSFLLKLADGTVLVLPTPTGVTIDLGVDITEVPATNAVGEEVVAKRFVGARKPTISATFGNKTPEVVGLKAGSKFELNASKSTLVQRSGFLVPADGVVAAAGAGQLGTGVAADASASASYLDDNGVSTTLTQGAFAGFDAGATPLEFAIGADNAQLYGQSLWGKYVTWEVPVTITNVLELGEEAWGVMSLSAIVVEDNLQVNRWFFPKVQPDPSGQISLDDPTQELPFFINLDSSDCKPFDVDYLGQAVFC